jgi:glycerol kinase
MIFNHSGRLVSVSQKEHRQVYLQPDRVEHIPLEIWERTQQAIRSAVAKAGAQPGDIAAVGVTNQRETTVVWNRRTGQPYTNAIVWQDTRTRDICHELAKNGSQDRFRAKTGLPLTSYFSGPKIKWILDHVDGVRADAERGDALFGTVDTWLIWWLTGGPADGSHVTDVSNASRTLLMNLHTLDWDDDILSALDIPRAMLPGIAPSSDPQTWGATLADGPFGASIPVCGNLGDQQAPLVGQTCFNPGEAKNTYGIACFVLLNTGARPIPSTRGLLTTLAYKFADQPAVYALEGSIAVTGGLVQWLRDNLGIISTASEVEDLARTVEDNGGIYIVPAFSGLFAPYWRSDARGVVVGMTHATNKGHLARAALEAIAYQTRAVLDAMKQDSGMEITALKVNGNMVYNELLMQFQADILGVPIIRPEVSETASLGAAYAAGLAIGFWDSGSPDYPFEDLYANWHVDKTWYPGMDSERRERLYRGWLKAVERSFDWVE